MSQKVIRMAFMDRLTLLVYASLKDMSFFSGWDTTQLYRLAGQIVAENAIKINEFLDKNNFSVSNIDEAAAKILREILLPAVKNMKI